MQSPSLRSICPSSFTARASRRMASAGSYLSSAHFRVVRREYDAIHEREDGLV